MIPYPSRPCILVVSFAGVVLIARPAALFGDHGLKTIPDVDKVATSDRMKAVVQVIRELVKPWTWLLTPLHTESR